MLVATIVVAIVVSVATIVVVIVVRVATIAVVIVVAFVVAKNSSHLAQAIFAFSISSAICFRNPPLAQWLEVLQWLEVQKFFLGGKFFNGWL